MGAGQVLALSQMNCWAKAQSGRKHLLIYPNVRGLLVFGLVSNVRLLVIPVILLAEPMVAVAQALRKVLRAIMSAEAHNERPAVTVPVTMIFWRD